MNRAQLVSGRLGDHEKRAQVLCMNWHYQVKKVPMKVRAISTILMAIERHRHRAKSINELLIMLLIFCATFAPLHSVDRDNGIYLTTGVPMIYGNRLFYNEPHKDGGSIFFRDPYYALHFTIFEGFSLGIAYQHAIITPKIKAGEVAVLMRFWSFTSGSLYFVGELALGYRFGGENISSIVIVQSQDTYKKTGKYGNDGNSVTLGVYTPWIIVGYSIFDKVAIEIGIAMLWNHPFTDECPHFCNPSAKEIFGLMYNLTYKLTGD